MKFSEQWLREWVNPDISTADLAAQLTMAGLEVDAVEPVAPFFSGVVVGEVLEVRPHPAADRLRVCKVNVDGERPLSIVCGAANVAPGIRAPLAVAGAKLPGGAIIERSALRGVESEGMLCSAKELGLAENAEGLLLLPPDAEPGRDLRDYLALSDVSFELGLTPNRGDCLSVRGIAREAAAINRCGIKGPDMPAVQAQSEERFLIAVEAPAACPRYLGRVVRDVDPAARTPMWMQERLRRSGLRSISAVVDVTNYVLLELGQPLHAFDLERLQGGIRVRTAKARERLRLLDGQEIGLDQDTLVIADHKAPVALAGIMGGKASAVSDTTRHLFLESAFFSPSALAGRARRYGLHTDSSHRFERGVDPALARLAMERATALLVSIAGGRPGPIIEQSSAEHLPMPKAIHLRAARLQRLIGSEVPRAEVGDVLRRLGMDVAELPDGWQVTPPGFRFDVAIEADLIEEVARLRGYDRLPVSRPAVRLALPRRTAGRVDAELLRRRLIERGYQEAITYSFVDPKLQALLDPHQTPLALANPISADMAVMRTSLWPGLMQALLYNLNRQQERIRLFEIGTRFRTDGKRLREERVAAGITVGYNEPEQWGSAKRPVDFYDVKADVESLLALGGGTYEVSPEPEPHPALHPGQAARITGDRGQAVGVLGGLHPQIGKTLDISALPVLFELVLEEIREAPPPRFRELSKFPAIRRDLALVVDEDVASAALCREITRSAGELLRELQLFDVYKGKGIDSGKKSIALGLTLQNSSRTLTDGDVESLIERVLTELREKFGATLRD
jgi:phenylalanyl-tRNA synthetase beta chain